MTPCELNVAITAVANYLYATLSKEDFLYINVVLSELSKTMFSMELLRDICDTQNAKGRLHANRADSREVNDSNRA